MLKVSESYETIAYEIKSLKKIKQHHEEQKNREIETGKPTNGDDLTDSDYEHGLGLPLLIDFGLMVLKNLKDSEIAAF